MYIPPKIKVGFQSRGGTYTNKLAYVVPIEKNGKMRKQKSWEGWRHKDIEPEEYDNKPIDGYVLNKAVQRYKYSHFGSNRSVFRIYDPRGFEFEIKPDNLELILMNTNCMMRGLEGNFVYAWHGADLVLLPEQSIEYQELLNPETKDVREKSCIAMSELVPGKVYHNSKEKFLYLGRGDNILSKFNKVENGDSKYIEVVPVTNYSKDHIFLDSPDSYCSSLCITKKKVIYKESERGNRKIKFRKRYGTPFFFPNVPFKSYWFDTFCIDKNQYLFYEDTSHSPVIIKTDKNIYVSLNSISLASRHLNNRDNTFAKFSIDDFDQFFTGRVNNLPYEIFIKNGYYYPTNYKYDYHNPYISFNEINDDEKIQSVCLNLNVETESNMTIDVSKFLLNVFTSQN